MDQIKLVEDNVLKFLSNIKNEKLKSDFELVTTWFYEHRMLLISGNCHYVSLGSKTEKVEFLFDEKIFENSK